MSKFYDPYHQMSDSQLKMQISKLKDERKSLLVSIHSPEKCYDAFQRGLRSIRAKTECIKDLTLELAARGLIDFDKAKL